MTIAVFNKGTFVDFWLNDISDKTWIERTIGSKGWLRQDVEVYLYEMSRQGTEVLSFDSEKNLQKIRIEESTIDEIVTNEDGSESVIQKPIRTAVVEQTYLKIPHYLNGSLV